MGDWISQPVNHFQGRALSEPAIPAGYAALIELQPDTYTVESIASRVGRSPAYVSGRLRLIQLIAEAKQAFYEDKLTVAHAFEIARLQPLCGGVSYVAFGSGTVAGTESNRHRMPHNLTYSDRRNVISPLS